MPSNPPFHRENPTIASRDYFGQHERSRPFNEVQREFFILLPDERLRIDYARIISLPEFESCMPAFEKGARKFYNSPRQELDRFIYDWLRVFFDRSEVTMWRSSMYGTLDSAEALARLAERLGFLAFVEQPYGDGEMDFAVTVDCRETL